MGQIRNMWIEHDRDGNDHQKSSPKEATHRPISTALRNCKSQTSICSGRGIPILIPTCEIGMMRNQFIEFLIMSGLSITIRVIIRFQNTSLLISTKSSKVFYSLALGVECWGLFLAQSVGLPQQPGHCPRPEKRDYVFSYLQVQGF